MATSPLVVEDAATALRLPAINARVEAVRSGDRGAGFAVVADELQHAGKESRAIAEQIRDGVAHMTTGTSELATLLRDGATSELASIEASRTQVAGTSEALSRNHGTLHARVLEGADLSRSLAGAAVAAAAPWWREPVVPSTDLFRQGLDPVVLFRDRAEVSHVRHLTLHVEALPGHAMVDPESCDPGWTSRSSAVAVEGPAPCHLELATGLIAGGAFEYDFAVPCGLNAAEPGRGIAAAMAVSHDFRPMY